MTVFRVVRVLLQDSPVSRVGYLFAHTVGFGWGFLWSTGHIERHNGLFIFRGMPRWSFRRGGSCVGGCYLTADNVSGEILEHEAVHQQQWRRFGMLFSLLYLLAGQDAHNNRFEIEAGLEKGGYIRR